MPQLADPTVERVGVDGAAFVGGFRLDCFGRFLQHFFGNLRGGFGRILNGGKDFRACVLNTDNDIIGSIYRSLDDFLREFFSFLNDAGGGTVRVERGGVGALVEFMVSVSSFVTVHAVGNVAKLVRDCRAVAEIAHGIDTWG
jgi:hypothetical protein